MAIENSIVPKSFRPAVARLGRQLIMCGMLSGMVMVCAELPAQNTSPTQTEQSPDNAIAQDINQKIMASKTVLPLNLGVWVHEGTVTLTGNVATQQLREDAENLVKSVAGVQNVENKITVGNVPATAPITTNRQNPDQQNPDEQNGGEQSARDSGYAQNAPPPVYDTQRHQSDMLDVSRGTPVYVMIMRRIDSRHSKPGEQFHGIVVQDVVEQNGMIAIPRGADITGTVVDARGPGHLKGRPEIALQLDSLSVANSSYHFTSYMWSRGGPGKGGQSAANIGGSAAAGAIIGGAVGGGGTALLGGLLGGLGGAGLSALSSGPRLIVPSESILTFYLNAPVTVREPTRGEIDMLASRVPPAANGYGRRGYYGSGYPPLQPGYGQPGYPPPPPPGPPGGYPY